MTGQIEFGTYEPEEKVNEYAETVARLAELDNENAAVKITVDANDVQNTQNKVQRAANGIDKTARIRHRDYSAATIDSYDEDGKPVYVGNVTITFTLTSKHKARRKGSSKPVEAEAEKPSKK